MQNIDFDKIYNLDNKNYEPQVTECWVGQVPWDAEYTNIVDFSTQDVQENKITSIMKIHKTDCTYIQKDSAIILKGNADKYKYMNYCCYFNANEYSRKMFYNFIDRIEYVAKNTTKIYLKTDVWQTWQFDTVFRQSWIERSHVPKSSDTIGGNLEPEPLSPIPIITRESESSIGTNAQWDPQWVLHAASKYNSSTGKYEYDGVGDVNTFAEYGFYIDSKADIKTYLEEYGRKSFDDVVGDIDATINWKAVLNAFLSGGTSSDAGQALVLSGLPTLGELQDHRDELIGLYAIPKWARTSANYATNEEKTLSEEMPTTNNLACGYTPRNKKMLSSMFKAYVLYSRSGIYIPLKPEAIDGKITVECACIPMDIGGFYLRLRNYNERDKQFLFVGYRGERRVGYDANTGLNKAITLMQSVPQIAGGVASVIAEPTATFEIAGQVLQQGVNLIDKLGTSLGSFGNNTNLINITNGRATLRWTDISPTLSECERFDSFFDCFGYSINEFGNPRSYFTNRSNWNYIKTRNLNFTFFGNKDDESEFASIFNNGTTVWHNIDTMGDYTKDNN
jgi:hypothetical protein